jgi:hypothetical protein
VRSDPGRGSCGGTLTGAGGSVAAAGLRSGQLGGGLRSWAAQWAKSLWLQRGLQLYPTSSEQNASRCGSGSMRAMLDARKGARVCFWACHWIVQQRMIRQTIHQVKLEAQAMEQRGQVDSVSASDCVLQPRAASAPISHSSQKTIDQQCRPSPQGGGTSLPPYTQQHHTNELILASPPAHTAFN